MLRIGKNKSGEGFEVKNVLLNIVLNFVPCEANLPLTNQRTKAGWKTQARKATSPTVAQQPTALRTSPCTHKGGSALELTHLPFQHFTAINPTKKHLDSLPMVISVLRLWWPIKMQASTLQQVCLVHGNEARVFAPQWRPEERNIFEILNVKYY